MTLRDFFIDRYITVELLADAAASQPDPREWLARLAGALVGVAAEMQRDGDAAAALQASGQRAEISEIMDATADALERILRKRTRDRGAM